ncbi:MAG: 3-deoxy-manno-octulosonate cytidylyltransferase [Desulfobacterales bacterium]|nr:3-deoxy-manno-octulosonate cytidylyltransferase [Desulfobacterales bacterium]
MRILLGIPVRMASTRFPGKPLCDISGMSMVEHVYKRCALSRYATDLFVAACDDEVRTHVEGFGGKVIMTDPSVPRAGLRVATAAEDYNLDKDDIVVVIQGDEPLVHPDMIDLAIKPLLEEKDVFVSNLCRKIEVDEWEDPAEIKVVCDMDMNAMYMSRSPIPSTAHEEARCDWWKQVCIMPFRWHFMQKFNHELEESPLELQESVEMLRAMQHGYKVRMVPSGYMSKSVDTEEDRLAVEKMMANDPVYPKYRG